MNCPVCNGEEFKDLDYLRNKNYWYIRNYIYDEKIGFQVCKKCGFLTYEEIPAEKLSERYQTERAGIGAGNIITGNRKMEYHKRFLGDLLQEEKTLLDYGCAQGLTVAKFRDMGINAAGMEIDKKCLEYAKNKYGVDNLFSSHEEVMEHDENADIIMLYHVLEHLQKPDKILSDLKTKLADCGVFYISVPVFLDQLHEASGTQCSDFENLYHLNHINCFTYTSLRNLLGKVGIEIVKENRSTYGYTVLAKPTNKIAGVIEESWQDVVSKLESQQKAIQKFIQRDFKGAVDEYKTYPEAWIGVSVGDEKVKDFNNRKAVLEEAIELMPYNTKLKLELATAYTQWDMGGKERSYTNNIKEAEKILLELEKETPAENIYLMLGELNMMYKKDYKAAIEYFTKVIEINPTTFGELENKIGYCAVNG